MIASKQNATLFSDKEQVWADNAASSPFFGNVYVCYADFRGTAGLHPPAAVRPGLPGRRQQLDAEQVTPAANNVTSPQGFGPRVNRTVRTDSTGRRLRLRRPVRCRVP